MSGELERRRTETQMRVALRAEARELGRRNRLLREAIQYTAIPTLSVFAEHNDGVRQAIKDLRRVVAESTR